LQLSALDPRVWPARTRLLFGVLVTLGVGWVDYVTGNELRVYPLYFLPLTIGAWQRATTPTLGLSVTTTLTWMAANWLSGMTFSRTWMWTFNAIAEFAAFAAFAVLIARLSMALAKERLLARTDSLTGLLNSRQFREEVAETLDRAQRSGEVFALVFLDLDNFKWVNDNLGHKAGDRMLFDVAAALQRATRRTDRVARLGGDEFAVLLPDTALEQARAQVQRLMAELHEDFAKTPAVPVTASVGVAVFTDANVTVDAILQRADILMYRAKHAGKDQAIIE
jgi:diguanylate cyclase (GGDEF)-like protein